MERDPRVCVMVEDVGHYNGSYKVTRGMLHYTSGGQFTIPTIIFGPRGVCRQLGAEQSQRLEAYFQSIPGIQMVACSTPYNVKGLMKAAIHTPYKTNHSVQNQKASHRADGLDLWDYHVICIQKGKGDKSSAMVWDLDSSLPFPSPLALYIAEIIRPSFELFSAFKR